MNIFICSTMLKDEPTLFERDIQADKPHEAEEKFKTMLKQQYDYLDSDLAEVEISTRFLRRIDE